MGILAGGTTAGATQAAATGAIGVGVGVLMTAGAVGLGRVRAHTATQVELLCHRLQVGRVDAVTHAAQMVDDETIGYWHAMREYPRESVGTDIAIVP